MQSDSFHNPLKLPGESRSDRPDSIAIDNSPVHNGNCIAIKGSRCILFLWICEFSPFLVSLYSALDILKFSIYLYSILVNITRIVKLNTFI